MLILYWKLYRLTSQVSLVFVCLFDFSTGFMYISLQLKIEWNFDSRFTCNACNGCAFSCPAVTLLKYTLYIITRCYGICKLLKSQSSCSYSFFSIFGVPYIRDIFNW